MYRISYNREERSSLKKFLVSPNYFCKFILNGRKKIYFLPSSHYLYIDVENVVDF